MSAEGYMTETANITFRMDKSLLRYFRVRAAHNDRSINKEVVSILRDIAETEKEKAPGSRQANPDASHAE